MHLSAPVCRPFFRVNLMPVPLHINTFSLTRQGSTAIVNNSPGQRGGNVSMCAAIGHRGVKHAQHGLYNTPHLLTFLDELQNIPPQEEGPERPTYVVILDNVSFHRAALLWSTTGSLTIHVL